MRLLSILMITILTGCSSGVYEPTVAELANANYGAKPNLSSLPSLILSYYKSSDVYDPAGVLVEECQNPEQAWRPLEIDGTVSNSYVYGWRVECGFNAKGDSDEYLGVVWEPYFIRDGRVLDGYVPSAYKPVFR